MGVVTKLTDEEFLALPDDPGKQELLHGELISSPPAKQDHNDIAQRFFERLLGILPSRRVGFERGFRLKAGWLQPDVCVIWDDQPRGDWYEGAPMIAIEVASRGNTDEEIDRKIEAYLNEGGLEVWIVRPRTASMTVHRKDGVSRHTGVYNCAVLSTEINVSDLIGPPK